MIRVAFPLLGGVAWTGGLHYLMNLLSALRQHGEGRIEPLLFVEREEQLAEAAALKDFLSAPPLLVRSAAGPSPSWRRAVNRFVLQRDIDLERSLKDANVSVVFQQSSWHGFRFGLPTLTWIPDFQYRHLPEMITRERWLKRELKSQVLVRSATHLMMSSEDARCDCETFYPASRGRISVVPFAVAGCEWAGTDELAEVSARHQLPERFFYLPNQLWKHKNHLLVVEALALLRQRGVNVNVVSTGNLSDVVHPQFPPTVLQKVKDMGLDRQFRFLGLVPRADIPKLMQGAVAVLNPSLFEGWSTVVEEAKSLGVPLLLSDLRVHREQAPDNANYFDPRSASALAEALQKGWDKQIPADRNRVTFELARERNLRMQSNYAERFSEACKRAIDAFDRPA